MSLLFQFVFYLNDNFVERIINIYVKKIFKLWKDDILQLFNKINVLYIQNETNC